MDIQNRKGFRISFNSPVILSFTGICLIAVLLDMMTNGRSTDLVFSTYRSSLASPLTYIRFVGHVFGHAGWEHLVNNMMYILILGPMLEEKYGAENIILLIVATALVTGIINFIFFPRIALYGASGVVFAMILLSSITGLEEHSIPLTFILVAALYTGQQVYEAFAVGGDISYLSHILGGATGAVIGFALNRHKLKRHPY